MATRYEVVLEDDGNFQFQLRSADGDVILRGLSSPSKIMTQNEILHLRSALRDDSCVVPHESTQGEHFVVVKDRDGSVLAKSTRVGSSSELDELVEQLHAAATAPIVDLSKHRVRAG